MKIAAFILSVLLFSTSAYAKKEFVTPSVLHKNDEGRWTYEKVVEIPSTNKEELYTRVKAWILSNITSVDNNAVIEDQNHETLVTNPSLTVTKLKKFNHTHGLNFKLTCQFKDNKIRVTAVSFYYLSDQIHSESLLPLRGPLEDVKIHRLLVKELSENIDQTIAAFMASLEKAAKKDSKNDW